MRVLVTGAGGQPGQDASQHMPARSGLTPLTRFDCAVTHENSVQEAFARIRRDVVINAAAYTAVDRAEREQEAAYAVNAAAAGHLEPASRKNGARLIHAACDGQGPLRCPLITRVRIQLAGEVMRRAPAAPKVSSVSQAECGVTYNVAVERVVGDFRRPRHK